jgi:hypothetical protein
MCPKLPRYDATIVTQKKKVPNCRLTVCALGGAITVDESDKTIVTIAIADEVQP